MAEHMAAGRTADGKPAAVNTLKKWKSAQKMLNRFFGNRNLREITPDDAAKFRRWLDESHLGENTKRTHVAGAKMFLNAAKRRKLVEENPFEGQKASLIIDRSRDFYLSRANAMKIIDACPDAEWRLIVALWRFAGLRKMEIFHLRWEHVLWDKGRMLVTCQKTAHHEGKGSRFVPTADILPYLEAVFHEAPEGTQRVITRFTASNVNLAKPFEKIITAAGLTVWPKLIQNLRASCETDWLDSGIAAHVVAKWIGHSVKVQNDNYAQVDDHHFDQFAAHTANLVAIQVASKTSETVKTGEPIEASDSENLNVFRDTADGFASVQK
ncbi:MAG: tyrosine-type recombinase/integrase, partial [Phycisphaerae bacterium]